MQNQKSALGLDGNVTALIAYPIGIVALVLLFIEKENKFVRFHAIQSLLFWAAFVAILVALGIVSTVTAFISGTLAGLLGMISLLVWLALMAGMLFMAYKAYQGSRFKLPVIGDMAEKWA